MAGQEKVNRKDKQALKALAVVIAGVVALQCGMVTLGCFLCAAAAYGIAMNLLDPL